MSTPPFSLWIADHNSNFRKALLFAGKPKTSNKNPKVLPQQHAWRFSTNSKSLTANIGRSLAEPPTLKSKRQKYIQKIVPYNKKCSPTLIPSKKNFCDGQNWIVAYHQPFSFSQVLHGFISVLPVTTPPRLCNTYKQYFEPFWGL